MITGPSIDFEPAGANGISEVATQSRPRRGLARWPKASAGVGAGGGVALNIENMPFPAFLAYQSQFLTLHFASVKCPISSILSRNRSGIAEECSPRAHSEPLHLQRAIFLQGCTLKSCTRIFKPLE